MTRSYPPAMRAVALLTALALFTTGCTTVHAVRPTELTKLNGFVHRELSAADTLRSLGQVPQYALVDVGGDSHTFDGSTRLVLDTAGAGETDRREDRYQSVVVQDGVFSGMTLGDGQKVQIPMGKIEMAGVRRRSIGKTVLLAAGIATGLFVLLLIAGANAPESNNSNGGGDTFD